MTFRAINRCLFKSLVLFLLLIILSLCGLSVSYGAEATPKEKEDKERIDTNKKSKIKLIYPSHNMIIYEKRDWITGITKVKKATTVNFRLIEKSTGDEIENSEVDLEYNLTFLYPVEYTPGINTIIVDDYKIDVYYQEDEDKAPPEEFKEMFVHQSVPDLCAECHDTYIDKEFPLIFENQVDICENCHKSRIYNRLRKTYKYIHDPVKKGECTLCHDIHISEIEHMLKKPQNELCIECHGPFVTKVSGEKFVHLGEMYDRICTKCHNPHSSEIKSLIRDRRKGICMICHEAFSGEKEGVKYKSIHKPVVQGKCYLCHEIHKGRNKMFLIKEKTQDTCVFCHNDKLGSGHGAKLADCTECHNAHISDKEGLFTDKGVGKCLECHKNINYKKEIRQKSDCQLCHNPHSNENRAQAIASCVNCHNEKKLTELHSDVTPSYENCSKCHDLHGEIEKGLLKKNMHKLKEKRCKACHTSKNIESAKTSCLECHKGEYDVKHPFTAVNESGCINCHKVHGGGVEKLLEFEQHKPFKERKCKDCHKSMEDSMLLTVKANSGELCLECHKEIDLDENKQPYVTLHKPFKERRCIDCHDTHLSENPKMLLGQGAKFCYRCHKRFEFDENGIVQLSIHQPVNNGECSKCHLPHGSAKRRLLKRDGQELCFSTSCHKNFLEKPSLQPTRVVRTPVMSRDMISGQGSQQEPPKPEVPKYSNIHKPINESGCTECHSPHSSNIASLLLPEGNKFFCYKCHKDFTLNEEEEKLGFIHEPVLKEDCMACHVPHANDNPKLLTMLPNVLCMVECHKNLQNHHKTIKSQLESMAKVPDSFLLEGGQYLVCTNCHSPHSGSEKGVFVDLKKSLCLKCHSSVPQ